MDAESLESTIDISPQRPICGLLPAECQSLRQNFQRFRLYCFRTSHQPAICYKEFAHAFSCTHISIYGSMHLGSLVSTLEARVARVAAESNSNASLSCSPNFPRASITRYTNAKHEQILIFAS